MRQQRIRRKSLGLSACAVLGLIGQAQAADADDSTASTTRMEQLKQQVAEQTRQLDALKRAMAQQEATLDELRRAVGAEALAAQRGGQAAPGSPAMQLAQSSDQRPEPVGQAPERDGRAPAVAPIFEQPGVLTPKGKFVFEPSLQYSYSSSNRIALVGYTIIPAILIGVIDVREVKRNTTTGTLTGRYGISNRFEFEARLPYTYRSDTSIGREVIQGAATDSVFNASGQGIGDVEVTGRYQLNDGGLDKPYYVASLRFKSRTGKDPFQVTTTTSITGLRDGVQTELPTGSGFYGLQPALTVLYPSDPAVFFGTVSYLHSFKRDHVVARTNEGDRDLGTIQPGGIIGFNFGMGLALNERSSFSIGYDHSSVGRTLQNGEAAADSVRVQLGTLLLGYSLRLDAQRSLNVSLGVGATRDTPDITLTMRVPFSL